jgi:predicted ATPase/DNA-binding SARP family transcriptional activator
MAQSWVLLLGPFQIEHSGTPLAPLRLVKAQALLAYLAVEADRPHLRSALAGLLWPEQPEEQALRNLSQALVRLRQAFPEDSDPLLVTRQTVQWHGDGTATIDVTDFLRLAGSGAVAGLEQAAALYREEFLAGFGLPECEAFEEWLLLTRERLGHQALEVLARLAEGYLAAGQERAAIEAARRQLALDPWREAAYRQLMRALAQSGDRAGALAAYTRCQQVLANELEITPDAETRLLAEQIEAGVAPVRGERPVPATRPARTHNLPAPLASLVGREGELAQLQSLAQSDTRLVTVVGPGGSGKTRLALAAAWDLRSQFPDGVWWVELGGIQTEDDPTLERTTVASAVAAALGMTLDGRRPPLDELAALLGERNLLVVLDNCEHLPEVAAIAHTVLAAAPHLRVLATSRERLGLSGETMLPLEGLPVPEEGAPDAGAAPSVQLFLDRAARHTPGWGQDKAEVDAAGRLCRLLEGMPLGIELAAHWVGHYAPDEIAAALQSDLAFLTAQTHDVPERQRSLRAVFAYSWNLLTETEREALARLSVFRGGADRPAARAVAGIATTTLVSLVDKSLLRRLDVGRYRLHALLRQFAAEKLAEAEETTTLGDRHLAHFLDLAEQAAGELRGPNQREWLDRLDRELDNLRAALAWARERGEEDLGLRLASALGRFWEMRSHVSEGRTLLAAALAASASPARPRAAALHAAGRLAYYQGDVEQAETLDEEALALWRQLGDSAGIAASLNSLGTLANREGDAARAVDLHEEALALWRELGDRAGIAVSVINLGGMAYWQGDAARALALHEEALAMRRELGDRHGIVLALINLGAVAFWLESAERASVLLEEALPLARELGDQVMSAMTVLYLGHSASRRGDVIAAAAHFQEVVRLSRATGERYMLPYALEGWGWATRDQGGSERAAQLYGAAAALRAATHTVMAPPEARDREEKIAALRETLSAAVFERAWAEGERMRLEEAMAVVLQEASTPASLDAVATSHASGPAAR